MGAVVPCEVGVGLCSIGSPKEPDAYREDYACVIPERFFVTSGCWEAVTA